MADAELAAVGVPTAGAMLVLVRLRRRQPGLRDFDNILSPALARMYSSAILGFCQGNGAAVGSGRPR